MASATSSGSVATDAALSAVGPLAGKRIGILVEFNYEDLELWYPKLRFIEDGADCFTVRLQRCASHMLSQYYSPTTHTHTTHTHVDREGHVNHVQREALVPRQGGPQHR